MKFKESIIEGLKSELVKARKEVNTNPSEAQIKAENYKMGHIKIMGFDITIENPKNSYRQGVDPNGKKWKTKMYYDYGYFKHTLGKDGDAIDVFIGDNLKSDKIFVIDQFLHGKFDESKVMLGFNTEKQAKEGYLKNYEKDWKGLKKITEVPIDVFKEWLYDGYKQRKPFYQYKEIKKEKLNESVDVNSLFKDIKNFYGGTTDNVNNIRGYIFPDGSVVDIDNKSHEDVRIPTNGMGIKNILSLGVIRLEFNGISLMTTPTLYQKQILRNILSGKNNSFFVDFYTKNGLGFHVSYVDCNVNTANLICNHITRYLEEGIKPERVVMCNNMLNEGQKTSKLFKKIENKLNFKNSSNLKLCKIQKIKDKFTKEIHYIAEIYGGLNGNGEWVDYLDDIQYILVKIPNSWIVDLSCDCADDVWTLKVGFREKETLNEGVWGVEWYQSDQVLDNCGEFSEKVIKWLIDKIREKIDNGSGYCYCTHVYGYLGMIYELLKTEQIFHEYFLRDESFDEFKKLIDKAYKYCVDENDYKESKKVKKKLDTLKRKIDDLLENKYKFKKEKLNEKVEYRFTVNEIKNRKNDEGKEVSKKCEECGSDVVLKIEGEPIFICSNEKCKKYYGVLPFSRGK